MSLDKYTINSIVAEHTSMFFAWYKNFFWDRPADRDMIAQNTCTLIFDDALRKSTWHTQLNLAISILNSMPDLLQKTYKEWPCRVAMRFRIKHTHPSSWLPEPNKETEIEKEKKVSCGFIGSLLTTYSLISTVLHDICTCNTIISQYTYKNRGLKQPQTIEFKPKTCFSISRTPKMMVIRNSRKSIFVKSILSGCQMQ